MFLNFRIPQATFYEVSERRAPYEPSSSTPSRLSSHVGPSKPANDKDEDERSWPRSVVQTHVDRLQKLFSKYTNATNDGTPSSTDDIQGLLQKGDNDPILPSLTRKQRILGFMMCLTVGILCLALSTLYIPVIVLKARKFAILFSFGSMFFLSSFSMLWGPMNHLKHLINIERLPFSVTYLLTLFMTIYCSIWVRSYVFTLIFALCQIGALVWYVLSYIPGGAHGLRFFSKLFYTFAAKTVSTTLSV